MIRLLAVLFVLGVLAAGLWRTLPPAWSPWAPLDVRAEVTPVTWMKLRALRDDNALCQQALASAPFRAPAVPDEKPHPPPGPASSAVCSLTDAVRVESGPVRLSPSSFLASCPLAVDWAMFVLHVLQPAAAQAFGRPAVQVDHLGSYACRDIAGTDEVSAHATANALDVAVFRIAGGPDVPVTDWRDSGPRGQFLHRLRDGACRYFGIVLSPEFNHAHAGHFHLQATGWGFCS